MKRLICSIYRFCHIMAIGLICSQGFAQEGIPDSCSTGSYYSSGQLFGSDEVLNLSVYTDFKSLLKDIGDSSQYHPAMVRYIDNQGNEVLVKTMIATRGFYRRMKENCNFPPLRFKFSGKESKNTLFEGQKILKLVTHCVNNNAIYEQYCLQEYLLYRVYNIFTNISFKVRLASVTYIDSLSRMKPLTRVAFFIEDENTLADRNHGKTMELTSRGIASVDSYKTDIFCLFQYMIGNTDWSLPNNHNVKFFIPDQANLPVLVPFDFDFAGVISTFYALPAPSLDIENVRERLYRGKCKEAASLQPAFDLFNAKKEEIFALYRSFPLLDPKFTKSTLEYYESFYKIINNPRIADMEFGCH
jgi:hypothetical protein